MALPPLPESVGRARAFVNSALVDADPVMVDSALLAVSEIATNAVVHAGTQISVEVSVSATGVRVAVTDGSPRTPRRRRYSDLAGTGRGLRLLTELTTRWGTDLRADGRAGKTVWFEISPAGVPFDQWRGASGVDSDVGLDGRPAADRGSGARSSVVFLLGTPVLLYAAWRQHAEALLRESFLARLDSGADEEAVRVHSEASDALALLDEAIPVAPATHTPAAALAAATAPEATADRLQLSVSGTLQKHFATLNRAMDDANDMVETHRLLTPAVQPELRLMRRWMCLEVASQCDGDSPNTWQSFVEARSAALSSPPRPAKPQVRSDRAPSVWTSYEVTNSETAVVAADDTATLVAVSEPAAQLLGYVDRTELVGQRLVSVIPERFRQAHLAGLTLHLLNGNGALLSSSVKVPVLRRDNSEALVTLTLHERHTAEGQPVFVGELTPE